MLASSDVIVFLATADASRARAFYESMLGLRLVADETFALVFDANGVMVRIAKVAALTPATHAVLGWSVADIVAAVAALGARGVTFERFPGLTQDPLGIWSSPDGAQVAWFKDPDGNVLSVTQFS